MEDVCLLSQQMFRSSSFDKLRKNSKLFFLFFWFLFYFNYYYIYYNFFFIFEESSLRNNQLLNYSNNLSDELILYEINFLSLDKETISIDEIDQFLIYLIDKHIRHSTNQAHVLISYLTGAYRDNRLLLRV